MQVYLILDEFLMGGEIQETSKKVVHCCPPAAVCLFLAGTNSFDFQRSELQLSMYNQGAQVKFYLVSWLQSNCGGRQGSCVVQVILERLAELDKIET